MIRVNELKGKIVASGYTQSEMARKLGITPKTFGIKLGKGVFGSDEIDLMLEILGLTNEEAMGIFFARKVTLKVKNEAEKIRKMGLV